MIEIILKTLMLSITVEQMIRFPIAPEEISRLRSLLPIKKPSKPYAFIFGHGLWNDLDLQATLDWLDTILDTITDQAHWLAPDAPVKSSPMTSGHRDRKRETGLFPRLFLTPNAAGKEKPDEWIRSQGNKALMLFEESVKVEAGRRGVEHLGTWNSSIQSNKFDGVYVNMVFTSCNLTLTPHQTRGSQRQPCESYDGTKLVEYA